MVHPQLKKDWSLSRWFAKRLCLSNSPLDYACTVYHSLLTKTQSEQLEILQRKILKLIYGFNESYSRCLGHSALDMLSIQRIKPWEKLALKPQKNQDMNNGFQLPKKALARSEMSANMLNCQPELRGCVVVTQSELIWSNGIRSAYTFCLLFL